MGRLKPKEGLTRKEWDAIWDYILEWEGQRAMEHIYGALPPMEEHHQQVERLVNAALSRRRKK